MNSWFEFSEGTSISNSEIFKTAQEIEGLDTDLANLDKPIAKEVQIQDGFKVDNFIEEEKEIQGKNDDLHNDSEDGENCTETEEEQFKNCPINNGEWAGERGNSTWKPDREYVPLKSNPEGKTWGEILDKHGIDGITFKDGEPDFSEISKGTVEIEPFSENRDDNFARADIELAKQRGCTPEEVREWRKENGYTWHECKDMRTMQKVPSEVHNNIPHAGGISEIKKGDEN